MEPQARTTTQEHPEITIYNPQTPKKSAPGARPRSFQESVRLIKHRVRPSKLGVRPLAQTACVLSSQFYQQQPKVVILKHQAMPCKADILPLKHEEIRNYFNVKANNFEVKANYFDVKANYFNVKAIYFNVKAIYFNVKAIYFNVKAIYFNVKAFYFDVKAIYFNVKAIYFNVKAIYFNVKVNYIDEIRNKHTKNHLNIEPSLTTDEFMTIS